MVGANLHLAVSLESRGNIAFTARNLQVAALIQDPDDPKRLTPIGTLVPETGLDTSFTLGPLVPPKGPIVFASTNVYPQLVDELMNDPRGLVFRFANYDIVDEGGPQLRLHVPGGQRPHRPHRHRLRRVRPRR